jgi:hypothetical protein
MVENSTGVLLELWGFSLAGLIAGVILLISHLVMNSLSLRPHIISRYIYGTGIWLICATIALLNIAPGELGVIAGGFWIVSTLAGLGVAVAYGLDWIGSCQRQRKIERELNDIERNTKPANS